VRKALSYDSNSELAKRIRISAIKHGCHQMLEVLEMETFHDSDNYMRQYLPNGAMLEFSKEHGTCDVIFKGDNVKHYEDVMLSEISGIQAYAEALR
jgi:Fe-S cluster assembly iron-binding protein IscA